MILETTAKTPAREAQQLFFEIGMEARVRIAAELRTLDLSFPLAHALRVLDPERPKPMGEIAELLVCDASNVTALADRLERRGLVECRSGSDDRRVKELALTPSGVRLRGRVLALMAEPPPAIAALSSADQRTLRDILRRAVERQRRGLR